MLPALIVLARLFLANHAVAAGASTTVVVELVPAAGWHLYGPQHGDAGTPPDIVWKLPRGIRAGAIRFPPSRRVRGHGLTTFEYDGPVKLRIPLTITKRATRARSMPIQADVSWVVCSNVCVPGRAVLRGELAISEG